MSISDNFASLNWTVARISGALCSIWIIYILYLQIASWSLFHWHPLLLTISFALFMIESNFVIALKNNSIGLGTWLPKGLVNSSKRRDKHYTLVILSIVFGLAGFFVIYLNKMRANKLHFTTYHSWAGVFAVSLFLLQIPLGYRMYNTEGIVGKVLLPEFIFEKLRKNVRKLHFWIGTLTQTSGAVALVLARYSNWMERQDPIFIQIYSPIAYTFAISSAVALLFSKFRK